MTSPVSAAELTLDNPGLCATRTAAPAGLCAQQEGKGLVLQPHITNLVETRTEVFA